jgi:hypothetical protein
MMRYLGTPRQRSGGASSLSADEGWEVVNRATGLNNGPSGNKKRTCPSCNTSTTFSKNIRPDGLKDRAAPGPCEADRLPTIYESVGEATRWSLVAGI